MSAGKSGTGMMVGQGAASSVVYCPYCHRKAELVSGEIIYPTSGYLHNKMFWQCAPCESYVGCHRNSKVHKPLGRLANKDLRRLRVDAHNVFDKMWKTRGMTRDTGYAWLAAMLNVRPNRCHIAMFGQEMCRKVIMTCGGIDEI